MPPDPHPHRDPSDRHAAAAPPRATARRSIGAVLGSTLALIPLLACGDPAPLPSNMGLAVMWEGGNGHLPGTPTAADKARIKEYRVKAALVLNFIKYANFPKSAFTSNKAPIVVLVVGKDPFGPLLERAFAKKTLHGRPIVIKRTTKVPRTLDAHVVFAGGLKDKDRATLIKISRKKTCLLIGEHPGFAEAGGFINLYLKKGKVKFEVNTERQKDTKIKLKAELLKLARIVKPSKPKEGSPR